MKKDEITTRQIFDRDQVLTVEKAKQLIGKRIAITNIEYRGNKPDVRIFTVSGFESEWDLAAKRAYPEAKFENFQQYWASYMTVSQITEQRARLALLNEEGSAMAIAYTDLAYSFYPEPTFFGSDADREIFFLEVE
jgi:hypothetical protein